MKVAIVHEPRNMRIEEEPDLSDSLAAKQMLVRAIVSGISAGTELSVYSGQHGPDFYGWSQPYPTELGYLGVGRIDAVGPDVTSVQPGDVIFVQKRHRQEYLVTEDDRFWKVPKGLQPEVAVFTYLINLALHALRRARLEPGETVAVVGLGPIGLGGVSIAKALGSPVIAIDPVAERRDLALKLGADAVLDPTADNFGAAIAEVSGPTGIDIAIETASTWSAIRTCTEVVRQEGRISIVALHPGDAKYNPIGELFYRKQLSLISTSFTPGWGLVGEDYLPERVRFTLRRNCQFILDGLAAGTIRYAPAVTHQIHYSGLPDMFERLVEGDRSMGAIAVHWNET